MEILNVILSFVSIVVAIVVAIVLAKQSKSIASLSNSTIQNIKTDIHELLQVFDNLQFKRMLRENGFKNINIDYELNLVEKFKSSLTSKLVVDQLDRRDTNKKDGYWLLFSLSLISENPKSCEFIKKATDILLSIEESDLKEMEKEAKRLDDNFVEWGVENKTYYNSFIREISDETVNSQKGSKELIQKFFIWLCDVKNVKDPDVELFYAVFKDDVELVKKALAKGADKTVTDMMLIRKYQTEYNEFISLLNQ